MKELLSKDLKYSSSRLVVFTVPGCSPCYPELEVLIDLKEKYGEIPITIILYKNGKGTNTFIESYGKWFSIVLASAEEINNYAVVFPSFMLVDSNYFVVNTFSEGEHAYVGYKSYIRNPSSENLKSS